MHIIIEAINNQVFLNQKKYNNTYLSMWSSLTIDNLYNNLIYKKITAFIIINFIHCIVLIFHFEIITLTVFTKLSKSISF